MTDEETRAEARRLVVGLVTAYRWDDMTSAARLVGDIPPADKGPVVLMALGIFASEQASGYRMLERIGGRDAADRLLAQWGAAMNS